MTGPARARSDTATDDDLDAVIVAAARRWRDAGWPDEAPALAAVKAVLRAQRTYQARTDALLAPYSLNGARYEVLLLVSFARDRALGHGEIARQLQVSAAAVTQAVDRLCAAGYVTREELARDRRQKRAVLTDGGAAAVHAATATMNREVFGRAGLSAAELDQLTRLASRLSRSLGRSRA